MSVTLIDGRSGSGKTTLADELAAREGAQVLHVEDLYPGWDGLAAGSRDVARVLDAGEYRRYDWIAGEFRDPVVRLDPARPLVIEGCGAITKGNLAAAFRWAEAAPGGDCTVHSIWLELGEEERRRRALARDGDTFAPHWERWAAQERAHYRVHTPWALADEVIRVSIA